MNRRSFLGSCSALMAWMLGRGSSHYGYVSVDHWPQSTVLLDGVDVSRDCYACDDQQGIVWLYERNANGAHFIDRSGHIASLQKRGRVVVMRKR